MRLTSIAAFVATILGITSVGSAARAVDVVHPGDLIRVEDRRCTAGFMFGDVDGEAYLMTAGHCVLDLTERERSWPSASGPEVFDASGRSFGRFVYAYDDLGIDVAIARVSEQSVSPAVRGFGGPTSLNSTVSASPVEIWHTGQGAVWGSVAPHRCGLATALNNTHMTWFLGQSQAGDSGSPVMTADGAALGIENQGGAGVAIDFVNPSVQVGTVRATRLLAILEHVRSQTGIELTLRTSPLVGRACVAA